MSIRFLKEKVFFLVKRVTAGWKRTLHGSNSMLFTSTDRQTHKHVLHIIYYTQKKSFSIPPPPTLPLLLQLPYHHLDMHAQHIKNSCERKTDRKRKERERLRLFGRSSWSGEQDKCNGFTKVISETTCLYACMGDVHIHCFVERKASTKKVFFLFPYIFSSTWKKEKRARAKERKKCFANANPKSSI